MKEFDCYDGLMVKLDNTADSCTQRTSPGTRNATPPLARCTFVNVRSGYQQATNVRPIKDISPVSFACEGRNRLAWRQSLPLHPRHAAR